MDNNKSSDQIELNEVFNNVYKNFATDNNILFDIKTYNEFKYLLIETINTFFPHLSYINEQIDDVLNIKYTIDGFNYNNIKKQLNTIDFNKSFATCEEKDNFYNKHRNNILAININTLTKAQLKLFNQYEYLNNLPQPAQKSNEWFKIRNGMLTASNGGAAIGESHYNTIKEVLLDKIGLGKKFKENKFVYHGKKYEKVAIMIYEIIYNTKIGEFGLIQHPTIDFLGASPDGISMSLTLNGKLNKLLCRMLEIKCPPSRKINFFGKIKGNICPDYYWIQVQLQLECCNLQECDFWQCHITEPYDNEEEFMLDDVKELVHSENQIIDQNEQTEIMEEPLKIQIDNRIKKGAIIELLPINKSHIPPKEPWQWYGKYIYPPNILMTYTEYKTWTTETVKNLKTLYPELMTEYKFSRIVYWKLETSHNELITRQIEWFKTHISKYEKFWARVLYYRNHLNEAKEDLIEQRLSNEVFLYTDSIRIPKINSLARAPPTEIKKSLKSNDIFISDNHDNKHNSNTSNDIFLTSSEPTVKKQALLSSLVSKTKQTVLGKKKKSPALTNKKNDNIDIFLDSVESNKNDNNNGLLDLVMVTGNRKKKNILKKLQGT